MATTKKTTATKKKPLDPKAELAKTEAAFDDIRNKKLDALVNAKVAHDKAVKTAKEDELAGFQTQMENFAKRVPFLCSLAKKLAVVGTVPTIPVKFSRSHQYEYVFSAFKYGIKGGNGDHWCVGIRDDEKSYHTVNYYVINETGVWLDYHISNKTIYATDLCKSAEPTSFNGPNVKEFMLAALEWEKKLIEAVDQL